MIQSCQLAPPTINKMGHITIRQLKVTNILHLKETIENLKIPLKYDFHLFK